MTFFNLLFKSIPQDFAVQVLDSLLSSCGVELLTDHQPDLHHFTSHQSHTEQNHQDSSQWEYGFVQQQLRFGKTLLLKQGHREGKVFLIVFLIQWNPN